MGQDPTKLLMTCALVKYSDENRYLTNDHLLFWSLGNFLDAPRFDEKLEVVAKELSLSDKLSVWRNSKEREVLEAYGNLLERTGFKKLHIQKSLPDCGEIDILGIFERKNQDYGAICEPKKLTPGGMTTFDYARRTYFIEEKPALQLEKKIEILCQSKRAQRAFLQLTDKTELPRAFVPLIILSGQPLPYIGRIPLITVYDRPRTIWAKIEKYLSL